ncbi:hypothetical protein [uncultured Erythrobacter sp.]|uniref:hypothetical protein n=1 Tax=uncultured Erythrobacter sp. TaxID=263913 RepID=UPI00262199C2|nr:hypothetical protein [uncultured Erythrobacter sp.]
MKVFVGIAAIASFVLPAVANAQVVVTGARQDRSSVNQYLGKDVSAIGLTRQADFFVKPLFVSSDSRDREARQAEVTAMLRATIAAAQQQGISLVAGQYTLEPVTADRLDKLTFGSGSRPDTTRVTIYARLPVGGEIKSADEANERIDPFVKSVVANGRSYIDTGRTSLAITDPDQYRLDVVKTVAREAKSYAAQFGSDYGVSIDGLDSDLYWKQASETEVFLYIEHSFSIKPK